MNSRRLMVAVVAMLSATTVARADATLTPVDGGVLVSKGQGFVRTTQATTLKVGDRAMVAQGSRGKITFPDGCAVDLRPGAVQIIGPVSPCARAQGTNERNPDALTGYGVAGAVIALTGTAAAVSLSEPDAKEPGFSP